MKWVTVHLTSLQCSLSPLTVTELFNNSNLNSISIKEFCFITSKLIIIEPLNHVLVKGVSWKSNYNSTHEFGPFKEIAFKLSKDIYLVPNHMVITLDDDFIGSCSKELQNKILSLRKAAKEGHAANVLCENFLSMVIQSYLRRIDESQIANVCKLLTSTFSG